MRCKANSKRWACSKGGNKTMRENVQLVLPSDIRAGLTKAGL